MRQLPLWDSIGWKPRVFLGKLELSELVGAGLATLKCRVCGGVYAGNKGQRPKNQADIEEWLQWLDRPITSKGCGAHLLEHHATTEYHIRPMSARSIGRADELLDSKRAIIFQSTGDVKLPTHLKFRPTILKPDLADLVYEQLVRHQ